MAQFFVSRVNLPTRAVRIRELGGIFRTCVQCGLKNFGSVTLRGDHFDEAKKAARQNRLTLPSLAWRQAPCNLQSDGAGRLARCTGYESLPPGAPRKTLDLNTVSLPASRHTSR
jgi:hypothetical protein